MRLSQLQQHWDALGRQDPLWAILTDPTRRGNRWDLAEFFDTGRLAAAQIFERAAAFHVPLRRHRALDFGCGVGRLTQAVAGYVDEVVGVDIAASMIELAHRYNTCGDRCVYQLNETPDLRRFGNASFDVVFTSCVLQHMEPRYSLNYIVELARVLAPGGYLEFDVPSEHGFFRPEGAGHARPVSAYRATVRIDSAPAVLSPGEQAVVRVELINDGTHTWQDADLKAGNHWARADGSVVVRDDARTPIDLPWSRGQHRFVELRVTAPSEPGVYRLQCDVVEEHVTWFADAESWPGEAMVTVGGAPAVTAEWTHPIGQGDTQWMEMHAVPRAEVERTLAAAGVRLLDVRRTDHCGPTWLAYRYSVTR
jgi:SAM-dependent methyltransferase